MGALLKDFHEGEEYIRWFDDFHKFTAGDWTITTTEAGAGSATEAASNASGGALVITNDNADNDADFLQWANETFKYVVNKRLYFKARFKVSDATESDFVIGLQITDTTPLAVSDGIFFQKDDGDTNLDFHIGKDSTFTDVTAIHTVVDDTYMTVEFYYDASSSKVQLIVDDVLVGSAVLTNAPDDEELTISFGIQNGAAAAKVMTIDYIEVVQER